MSDRTKIEWTDSRWNPIRARNLATDRIGWHCEHVSPGCANCYSGTMNGWRGTRLPYKCGHRDDIKIFLDEKTLLKPLKWRKPERIFVCTMTDLFADFVTDEMIDRVFAVMALAREHTFQVLTKRSVRMRAYMAHVEREARWMDEVANLLTNCALLDRRYTIVDQREEWIPLRNVWLGVSVEDQTRADERIPELLATPAAVRFVSLEPLLGPIDLTAIACPNGCKPPDYCNRCDSDGGEPTGAFDVLGAGLLDLVIAGGESGPKARPPHPDWVFAIRDQCVGAGTPFFFKRWGEYAVVYDRNIEDPDWRRCGEVERSTPRGRWLNLAGGFCFHGDRVVRVDRVGKDSAGRLLDGRTWDEMPATARKPRRWGETIR